MKIKTATPGAYQLFHEGSIAYATMESNGICIDLPYLEKTIEEVGRRVERLSAKLKKDPLYKTWRREFGEKTNLGSKQQLAHILFEVLEYPCTEYTEPTEQFPEGQPKVDKNTLEKIDQPFVKRLLRLEKYKHAKGTYLEGIRKEVVIENGKGFLHPFFNLAAGDDEKGGAKSYRGSSSGPNFNNIPIRDPEFGEMIRRSIIPREKNWRLVELDFKGLEVAINACYNKDPRLIAYLKDKSSDMHRDWACRVFKVRKDKEYQKGLRYYAKNMFVFPEFYGSFYIDCARALWDAMDRAKLTTSDGTPLKEHLASQGIHELGACDPELDPVPGTYEHHIKQMEKKLWEEFSVYADWKVDWYNEYRRTGGFNLLTGFRVDGLLSRNQAINIPAQGSAFHCCLWTQIELQKELILEKMQTKIIAEIHDSIIGDSPDEEVQDYLAMAKEITSKRLPKAWDWIAVPLEIEAEVAPLGASWWEKKPWHEVNGKWEPQEK